MNTIILSKLMASKIGLYSLRFGFFLGLLIAVIKLGAYVISKELTWYEKVIAFVLYGIVMLISYCIYVYLGIF